MGNNFPFLDMGAPQGTSVYGLEDGFLKGRYWQRTGTAVALGDVVQVDATAGASETNTADNTSSSTQGNVITPLAAFIAGTGMGMAAVVSDLLEDAGADNTLVECVIFGEATAFQIAASGSIAIGSELVVTTAKNFDAVGLTTERVFAQGREALATPTTRELGLAFVDNWQTITAGVYGAA